MFWDRDVCEWVPAVTVLCLNHFTLTILALTEKCLNSCILSEEHSSPLVNHCRITSSCQSLIHVYILWTFLKIGSFNLTGSLIWLNALAFKDKFTSLFDPKIKINFFIKKTKTLNHMLFCIATLFLKWQLSTVSQILIFSPSLFWLMTH